MSGPVHYGHRDQVSLLATWSLLGFCRLLILLVPFTVIRRLLGDNGAVPPGEAAGSAALAEAERYRAAHIGTLIHTAAQRTPWKSECYPQALAARTMLGLRRIPHSVSFGVRRDGDRLAAHAWVRAGDIAVTGGTSETYTEVGTFFWAPRDRE